MVDVHFYLIILSKGRFQEASYYLAPNTENPHFLERPNRLVPSTAGGGVGDMFAAKASESKDPVLTDLRFRV